MTEEQKRQLAIKKRLAELRASQAGAQPVTQQAPPPQQAVAQPAPPVQQAPQPATTPSGLNFAKMLADRDRICASTTSDFMQVSKLPEGSHRVRFIIPAGSDLFYAFRRGVWLRKWDDDAGEFVPTKVTSPLTDDSDAYCPCLRLSKALQQLGKETTGAMSKRANALSNDLYPKSEFLSNVLLQNAQSNQWTSTILVYGMSIYKALVSGQQANVDADDMLASGYLAPEANFADPEHGRVVVIEKAGKGINTRYTANISAKGKPLTPEELAKCTDLDQFSKPNPVDEVERTLCAYYGVDDFEMLIANIGNITLPEPAFSDKGKADPVAQPPLQRSNAPVQQQMPQQVMNTPADTAAPPANNTLPTCVGKFGTPDPTFACETCYCAEDCADIQELQTGA